MAMRAVHGTPRVVEIFDRGSCDPQPALNLLVLLSRAPMTRPSTAIATALASAAVVILALSSAPSFAQAGPTPTPTPIAGQSTEAVAYQENAAHTGAAALVPPTTFHPVDPLFVT